MGSFFYGAAKREARPSRSRHAEELGYNALWAKTLLTAIFDADGCFGEGG